MPRIQANRDAIDDRFSVLGFTVRSESPLFEVGVATDPALFRSDHKAARNRRNFFSSRSAGVLRARRGEAVYLVPPDVLANFIGQPRLYFGLATYRENSKGTPDFVQAPGDGSLYVKLSGLTERGLRRLTSSARSSSYGQANGRDASLEWGGDAWPQAAGPAGGTAATAPAAAPAPAAPAPYDDGFGRFPEPAPAAAAAPVVPAAPAAAAAQALRTARGLGDEAPGEDPDARGIDAPIPDEPVAGAARAEALDAPAPEYPQASRFVPAATQNYRAVTGTRSIEQVVLHITDGGAAIAGPISWFRNPQARVSAHYVIGQDGEVVQMVRHNDVAWHASSANRASIGIEHVANTRGLRPTPAQLCASAALVVWLCDQYGIPPDRAHILGHAEADPNTTHTGCPNAVWDWPAYMQMVETRSCVAPAAAVAQALGVAPARAQEIITPFYDPADPASALVCQDDAFSRAREEWFVGVPDTRLFPHSAICQLQMTAADGSGAVGTGFYIGRNRILTCAHNLHGMARVTIIPGRNGAGDKPYGEVSVPASSWRIAPRYSGDGDWANDLAVIDDVPLAAPDGRWFGFLNATPSERMPLVVCGYSRRSRVVPELSALMDGDKQHLHGGYAQGQSTPEVIEYPILTLSRASGSPVYHLRSGEGGQLEALVAAVHVSGEPAAQGLNRGCFITPDKLRWIEGLATSFAAALGGTSFSVHWDTVPYIEQQTDGSCWAAAAAMVVGWRDGTRPTDADIAAKVPVLDAYRTGLPPSERRVLADVWGLVAEPPASYTIDAWRRMLEDYGPLYLDMTNSAATGGHAWVLVGMTSDGAEDGSDTTMYLHNPTRSRGRVTWSFPDFLRFYEGRVGTEGPTLERQILHAASVPAHLRPVTAAPFALAMSSEAALQPAPEAVAPRAGLAAPPPAVVQQQGLRAAALAEAEEGVAVESPIVGTTLRRVSGSRGRLSWSLDQLSGLKHPDDAAPAVAAALVDAERVTLADWPVLTAADGTPVRLDLGIDWQFDGHSLGNVRIRPLGAATADDLALDVSARVADHRARYPADNPVCAALDVEVVYRYTRADGSRVGAAYAVRLFGNGRHNSAGRWLDD